MADQIPEPLKPLTAALKEVQAAAASGDQKVFMEKSANWMREMTFVTLTLVLTLEKRDA